MRFQTERIGFWPRGQEPSDFEPSGPNFRVIQHSLGPKFGPLLFGPLYPEPNGCSLVGVSLAGTGATNRGKGWRNPADEGPRDFDGTMRATLPRMELRRD